MKKVKAFDIIFATEIRKEQMKTQLREISVEKANGRIYTPDAIVCNILDLAGYNGGQILKKHVMENSCGDGAFLKEIVKRYCAQAFAEGLSSEEIASDLSFFIHGIEIDEYECEKCIKNVSAVAENFGLCNIEWDIRNADATTVSEYNGKMDFVLGNPPYIRVHNVGQDIESLKKFTFAQNGMTDIYIVFYEIGLKMLNDTGVLGYITPSSFFNSIAGERMRKYLLENYLIEKIVDMRHYRAFSATTYTAIAVLKKGKKDDSVDCYGYDGAKRDVEFKGKLSPEDFCIEGKFYFSDKKDLTLLKKISENVWRSKLEVKNGYATLSDGTFINDFAFTSKHIIPVVKASTGKRSKIIFPYDENGRLITIEELREEKDLYDYLYSKKDVLLKRSLEKKEEDGWYAFGRSQAIKDTFKDKVSINSMLRTREDLKITYASAGTGVYGGLYVVCDIIDPETVKNILNNEEFIHYVSLLGKYKSGGYYTFSSKDLKAYLDYKLFKREEGNGYEQCAIS